MPGENSHYFCQAENAVLGYDKIPLTNSPLSFGLPSGRLSALIGRNGAGKTTLLRAILGERVLLSGNTFLFQEKLDTQHLPPQYLAHHLAFVPQEHLYPFDLVLKDLLSLAYLPRMGLFGSLPAEADHEIDEILSFFSLETYKTKPLKKLSTGERQKAFLGRALLQKPKLLVLDEPTNHLDPAAVHNFWKLLLERQKQHNLDILVSTHDLNFVRDHCQWICALEKGNLFYNGTATEFWSTNMTTKLFGIP